MLGERSQQLGSRLPPTLPGLRKLHEPREIVDELPQNFIHGLTLPAPPIGVALMLSSKRQPVVALTAMVPPWGSLITALQNPGVSMGAIKMLPPSVTACRAMTSASRTAKLTLQCGGTATPSVAATTATTRPERSHREKGASATGSSSQSNIAR